MLVRTSEAVAGPSFPETSLKPTCATGYLLQGLRVLSSGDGLVAAGKGCPGTDVTAVGSASDFVFIIASE